MSLSTLLFYCCPYSMVLHTHTRPPLLSLKGTQHFFDKGTPKKQSKSPPLAHTKPYYTPRSRATPPATITTR